MRRDDFGSDFTWGVASAAWQVEGASTVGGKPPSVWDRLDAAGRIAGGPHADRAIDFYNRYPEDIALIAELGFGAKRLSISWPRLLGDGSGPSNPEGIAFYDRVIDETLAAGLEPWVTVHHWDMPQALLEKGGWGDRGIVEPFARLAELCAERYGDRVAKWMVFNEPGSVAGHLLLGMYGKRGFHPAATLRAVHHMHLAIAEGARRMRAVLPESAEIGTTHILVPVRPYGATDERTVRRKAAIEALTNGIFLDPPAGLGYPFKDNRVVNLVKPAIQDGDLEAVRFPFDFLGVQYYGPISLSEKRWPVVGRLPTAKVTGAEVALRSDIGIPADAEGLEHLLKMCASHPIAERLVVTESGLGLQDRVHDGRIQDDVRIWYVREQLRAVLAAKEAGVPVDGYFHWSYADNVEWFFGTRPRFGLVYIDYKDDLKRIPKESARWFQRFLGGEDA